MSKVKNRKNPYESVKTTCENLSKKVKSWTKKANIWVFRLIGLALTVLPYLGLLHHFGKDNQLTAFVWENIVLTPYNIVGVIMVILAPFGIWVGKIKGGKLLSATSCIAKWLTVISLILGVIEYWVGDIKITIWLAIKEIVLYLFNATFFLSLVALSICVVCILIILLSYVLPLIARVIMFILGAVAKVIKWILSIIKKEKRVISPLEENNSIVTSLNEIDKPSISHEKEAVDFTQSQEYKVANNICPECGGRLVLRQNTNSLVSFIGCSNYSKYQKCRYTLNYSEYKSIKEKIENELSN